VVVAESDHGIGAAGHLVPHEAGKALEVLDEALHGRRRHRLGALGALAKTRFLRLSPFDDPCEVRRKHRDQQVDLGKERLVSATELSIDIPAPIPTRVLQSLEAVDRVLEFVRSLSARPHAPALEDENVATAFPSRPRGHRRPIVASLVEAGQGERLAFTKRTDRANPEVHVVRPRHAPSRKQGVNRLCTTGALRGRQIEVVERNDGDPQSVEAFEKDLEKSRQRGLPSPLRAVESKHQRSLVDVFGDPRRHRNIEVSDEHVRGASDTLRAAPGFHLGSNIRDIPTEPTNGQGPEHRARITPGPPGLLALGPSLH